MSLRAAFTKAADAATTHAPAFVAACLMAGNAGFMLKHGLRPNLETAVGVLWIAADYALRQKNHHPVAAPRLNATGVVLGSLCLSASGLHPGHIDWDKVVTPLGYIPAAALVGFQHELHRFGDWLDTSAHTLTRAFAALPHHPYTAAAAVNSYGVYHLALSAAHSGDAGLKLIAGAYAAATATLPLLDARPPAAPAI